MENIVLTISMLVSGREETTKKSLLALQPLRKELGAEIILTNTGCTPEYMEEIRAYADKILDFCWCNDFAKARNVGLEAANGEWFLFIDDDEWFEDVTPILAFFQSGEYKEYHQGVYIARNYSNKEGTKYQDEWVSRMIRIEEDTHFVGSVHECLMPVRGKCKQIPAFVHHYGYVFETEEERLAHFKRNTEILEHLLETEPNNIKWPLQLLKEYCSVGDFASLRKVAQDALEKLASVNETFLNMCRGSFYIALLICDCSDENYALMWQHYEEFSKNPKNPWNVRAGMAGFLLLQAPIKEDFASDSCLEGEEMFRICANDYITALIEHEQDSYTEQQEIIADSIVFVKEYIDALQKYAQEIREHMEGNGEFLSISERAWLLAKMGILPLEEMLLDLPFSQWAAQMCVLQKEGYNNKWGETAKQLESICTQKNIRYIYFDMVLETIKMKQIYSLDVNIEKMSYEMMTQIIRDFAQANLNYMDYMYTDMAFEGEMELLSSEERASMWIANGLSIDKAQWREKLQCFGEAAKVCPMLGCFIKKYIKLLGEQLLALES